MLRECRNVPAETLSRNNINCKHANGVGDHSHRVEARRHTGLAFLNGRMVEYYSLIKDIDMSLNIKSAEADRLVEALSNLTGESKTQAVIGAVRERLEREKCKRNRHEVARQLLEIGRRCAAYGRRDMSDHGAFLYDERGLPK